MAYIKKYSNKIGDVVLTTKDHESISGLFEVGTEVTIIDIDDMRGYAIIDNDGNKMCEVGWII